MGRLLVMYMTSTTVLMLPQVVGWVVPMVTVVIVVVSVGMMPGSYIAILDHGIVVATQRSDEGRDLAMALVGMVSMHLVFSVGVRYDGWLHSGRRGRIELLRFLMISWVNLHLHLLASVWLPVSTDILTCSKRQWLERIATLVAFGRIATTDVGGSRRESSPTIVIDVVHFSRAAIIVRQQRM